MDSSTIITELKKIHFELDLEIQNLISLLHESSERKCEVFQLPRTLKDEEEKVLDHISVNHLSNDNAFGAALKFYQNFYLESPSYSSKSIGRLPGVISITTNHPRVLTQKLDQINDLKREFHSYSKKFKTPYHRHQVLHDKHNFPGLILTYLTRSISYHVGAVDSVSFSWVNKSNQSKITRDEAIEKLSRMQTQIPQGQLYDDVSWIDRVDQEKTKLLSLPQSSELRLYRPLKLKVITNLLLTKQFDDQPLKERKMQKEGNLPVILINSGNPVLHSLSHYDKNKIIKPGRIKSEPKLISKLLNLYQLTH